MAEQTLSDLGYNSDQPVDVIKAIFDLDLHLAVVPMDGPLGVTLRDGGGGILLTTKRGPGVQRYTAAHEVGHWVMHEGDVADGWEDVVGQATSNVEKEAQIFAAAFLMPASLLYATHAKWSGRRVIDPPAVYRMSREMGSSYEATVRRLEMAGLSTWAEAERLLKVKRMDAIQQAFQGLRPETGAAELWDAPAFGDAIPLALTEGDEVLLDLPENRTTPYRWRTRGSALAPRVESGRPRPPDPSGQVAVSQQSGLTPRTISVEVADGLQVTLDHHRQTDSGQGPKAVLQARKQTQVDRQHDPVGEFNALEVGQTGHRLIKLRAAEPGVHKVSLEYGDAFNRDVPVVLEYECNLVVQPTIAARIRRSLIENVDLDARLPGDPADEALLGD